MRFFGAALRVLVSRVGQVAANAHRQGGAARGGARWHDGPGSRP